MKGGDNIKNYTAILSRVCDARFKTRDRLVMFDCIADVRKYAKRRSLKKLNCYGIYNSDTGPKVDYFIYDVGGNRIINDVQLK